MESADLSHLPRIDRLLSHEALRGLKAQLGPLFLAHLCRLCVDEARVSVRAGKSCPDLDTCAARVLSMGQALLNRRSQPVINASGVLLHTNLGRAPLSAKAASALLASAGRYVPLEMAIESGKRGGRGEFAHRALSVLSGAESALVVNNNAAAVLLVLSALCAGKRVIVSRGELVEIGGGFRVPDVLMRSGAQLVEVGTTNKTRLSDYEKAISEGGAAAILRVHQANFRMTGFVERPNLNRLAELAHSKGMLLIKDLGGGAFLDLAPYGLSGEPTVQASIKAGCDILCFSTDKVFGGPQGGAIVGREGLVKACQQDALARALRVSRLVLSALEGTLLSYLTGDLDEIPLMRAVRMPLEKTKERALGWKNFLESKGISVELIELNGAMGGGALAEEPLQSYGIALPLGQFGNANALLSGLRTGDPAVLGRIVNDRVVLDARSVLGDEDEGLLRAILKIGL